MRETMRRARETSRDLLSKYLLITEFRFDTTLYCNLGNENSGPGHTKYSPGQQVPFPDS